MSRFFLNNLYYFITCSTIDHQPFFIDLRKDLILNNLLKSQLKYLVKDLDFGINSDHYHLLGYFEKGLVIPQFLKSINGPAAMAINKADGVSGRKIWDNYHVYYIYSDSHGILYRVRGYVIGNPYKHKEIDSLEKLQDYKYSSFKNRFSELGVEEAENMVLSVIKMNDEDVKKELEEYKDERKTGINSLGNGNKLP